MSIFHKAHIECPTCSTPADIERSASVNADLRPDLRAAILDGTFQSVLCAKCGARLRLPPHLTFMELGKSLWVAVEPASLLPDWEKIEDGVWKTYTRAFGDAAPPSARAIGAGIKPRLVFGWAALRETLICTDLSLDDITLELLKIAILRNVDESPMADETELRLVGGNATELHFAWFESISEQRLAELAVPRAAYDGIAADPAPWAALRDILTGVFFVDLRRMIASPDVAEAA
jgi:hypothetical protein